MTGKTMRAARLHDVGGKFQVDEVPGVGGVAETLPLEPIPLVVQQKSLIGSRWFTTAGGEDMAAMAASGQLDLSAFEHESFPLEKVNEALDAVDQRTGGFTNIVISH